MAGVALDWIAFPLGADPSEVGAVAIRSLGALNLAAGLITLGAIWVISYYRIDHKAQRETRQVLEGGP